MQKHLSQQEEFITDEGIIQKHDIFGNAIIVVSIILSVILVVLGILAFIF